MLHISTKELEAALSYPELITALEQGFQENYQVPLRHHHDFINPLAETDSTLLLMPAWQEGQYLGVKLVTVSPANAQRQLPSIQGLYLLFDAGTGTPLALMDAKTLTNKRTAAASALASRFLSRPDSKRLLMLGTGSLAPELIKAHLSVRPLQEIWIWGRSPEKAQRLAEHLAHLAPTVSAISSLPEYAAKADIISCATMSQQPILKGNWLQAGQHIDLVGSFKPDMRETDDTAIQRATVFVDTMEGATKETGDIVQPLQNGSLQREEIAGDLFGLCRETARGRREDQQITLFKSVGHALEDLVAAKIVYLQANVREQDRK